MLGLIVSVLVILLGGLLYRVGGSSWTSQDSSIKGLRIAKLAVRAFPVALAAWLVSSWGLLPCLAIWVLTAAADALPHGSFQGETTAVQGMEMVGSTFVTLVPFWAVGSFMYGGSSVAMFALLATITVCSFAASFLGWAAQKLPLNFSIGPIGFHKGPELGEFARGAARIGFVLVLIGAI